MILFSLLMRCVLAVMATSAASSVMAQVTPVRSVVSIKATASADSVTIAEPFELRVEVAAPKGSRVTYSPLTESLGEFEVIDTHEIPDVPVSARQSRWTKLISLETLELGNQVIPPIEVGVQVDGESSAVEKFPTSAIPIEVRSVLDAEEQSEPDRFRDIAGELPMPEPPRPRRFVFGWLVVGFVILLGIAFTTRWLSSRLSNRPDRWCRRELVRLKQHPVTDAATYVASAMTLKHILHVWNAYSITAATPSTSDLLESISIGSREDDFTEDLQRVMRCADRLKFSSDADNGYSSQEYDSLRRVIGHVESMLRRRATPPEATHTVGAAADHDRSLHGEASN